MTPAQAEAIQRGAASTKLQDIHIATLKRKELWDDLQGRIDTALSDPSSASHQLLALYNEAHKRLAKGW